MKRMTKAPSVPENLVAKVAAEATRQIHELGFKTLFAVPAKRTVQWRIKFESEKRAANVAKRADKKNPDSFGVAKNVIVSRIGGEEYYNRIMRAAYASVNLVYTPSAPTGNETPKPKRVAAPKVKGKRKTTQPVTDDDLNKVLAAL